VPKDYHLTSLVKTQRTEGIGITVLPSLWCLIKWTMAANFINHFIDMVYNFFVNKL